MSLTQRIYRDYEDAGSLPSQLSIEGFLDEKTFYTKSGDVGVVLEAGELDQTLLDPIQKDQNSRRMATAIKALPLECRLYQFALKRRIKPSPPAGAMRESVASVETARHADLSAQPAFEIKTYVVIVLERQMKGAALVEKVLSKLKPTAIGRLFSESETGTDLWNELNRRRAALNRAARSYKSMLDDIVQLSLLDRSDVFAFFRQLTAVNPVPDARLVPETALVDQLAAVPIECHRNHLRVGEYATQVLTLNVPPPATAANFLADIQNIPGEWTAVAEWKRISQIDARSLVMTKRRHHHAMRNSFVAFLTASKNSRPEDFLTDNSAQAQERELGQVLEVLSSGQTLGEYSLSIAIHDPDLEAVMKAASEFQKIFAVRGASLQDERYNLFNAWLATLPGNRANNLRRRWMLDTSVGDLSLIGAPDTGNPVNEHLNVPALAVLTTRSGTFYHLNLHRQDVAHTLVLGATGSGKSFVLNFVVASVQKYDSIVYLFDLGGSYRRMARYFGGTHCRLGKDQDVASINPFCLEPTQENLQFLYQFIRVLLDTGEAEPCNPEGLYENIVNLYQLEPSHRRLGMLARMLSREQRDRLTKWCEGGQFGWLFDNVEDHLTFARLQSIDFQAMDRTPDLLQPLLFYVLHRASQTIDAPEEASTFKVFIIDEAWRFFRHPLVRDYILEAVKTWRKRNAALIIATQSGDDLGRSELLAAFAENCPTKIFLSNPGMDAETYMRLFHLNATEAEAVMNLVPKREFLIKRPESAKVVELTVDPFLFQLCANVPEPQTNPKESQK